MYQILSSIHASMAELPLNFGFRSYFIAFANFNSFGKFVFKHCSLYVESNPLNGVGISIRILTPQPSVYACNWICSQSTNCAAKSKMIIHFFDRFFLRNKKIILGKWWLFFYRELFFFVWKLKGIHVIIIKWHSQYCIPNTQKENKNKSTNE